MVNLVEGSLLRKSEKKRLKKNNSFSGIESIKSPKERRKSLGATLKKNKPIEVIAENAWSVTVEEKTPRKKSKKSSIAQSTPKIIEYDLAKDSTSIKESKKKKHLVLLNQTPVEETALIESSKKYKKSSVKPVPLNDSDISFAINRRKKKVKTPKAPEAKKGSENFNIKSIDVTNAIKGVIKLRTENPKLENQLFSESVPLFLQISCHILPTGYQKICRVPLEHSFLTPDDEVCLIVPEVKGIKNTEHEKHVEHYEDILRSKGVENIKKIMTFHEFRTEYETYEQKSRLVDLYELFLVDSRISGKAVKKCGKIFYKKRKVPIPVKLRATKLKEYIDRALCKSFLHIHLKGNSFNVQFGHTKMDVGDLEENVQAVAEFLDKNFPGGFDNINGLGVYAHRTPSIPIYMATKVPENLNVPKLQHKNPKAYKSQHGELTTLPNAEVTVQPTGKVIVKRIKKLEEEGIDDNKITDKDIIQANKPTEEEKEERKKNRKKKNQEKERGQKRIGEGDTSEEVLPKKKVKKTKNKEVKNTETAKDGEATNTKKAKHGEITNIKKAKNKEVINTKKAKHGEVTNFKKAKDGEVTNIKKAMNREVTNTKKAKNGEVANIMKAKNWMKREVPKIDKKAVNVKNKGRINKSKNKISPRVV